MDDYSHGGPIMLFIAMQNTRHRIIFVLLFMGDFRSGLKQWIQDLSLWEGKKPFPCFKACW